MFRPTCVIVLTLTFISAGCTADTPPLTSSQVELCNKLAHQLIAPCCWREPIAIHRSPEALQMLDEVRWLAAEGRSEDEIKAIFVARYGARILVDPPGVEKRWLYLTPIVLVCCSIVLAALRLRALVTRLAPPQPAPPAEAVKRVRKEIDNAWI